ncbi:MAG: Ig-like domain-containing protein [bacterium]|nr:Ig-like domain-containing protein [bacterium]
MKKSKLYTSLLIIIILLSSVIVAKFFIGNNQLFAQVGRDPINPNTWGDIFVYLYYPPPEQNPIIYGQTDLIFNFTNIEPIFFGTNVTNFSIEVYNNPEANALNYIGDMYIVDRFQQEDDNGQPTTYWTFRVDTMDFENYDDYYFRMRAFVGTIEIPLIYSTNYNNVVGPLIIRNNPQIIEPQDNAIVSGSSVNILSRLNGLAQGVFYHITDSSGGIVDSMTATHPSGYEDIYWVANWNSTNVDNGTYIITLSFITLAGNQRNDVIQRIITVNNNTIGDPCVLDWQCTAWTPAVCPTTGVQTRTCLATNCGETQSRTEQQTCVYIPPGNQNSNTNTALLPDPIPPPPPPNNPDDPNLPPEPLPVPTINMQYPGQGDVVSGDIVLKAHTDISIASLDFLYKDTDINVEEFIGQANRSANNNLLWQRVWGTDQIPNGEYYVFARATMANGHRYLSDYIVITVDHDNLIPQSGGEIPVVPQSEDSLADSDGDGIDDTTEMNIGTDPNNPEDSSELGELVDQAVLNGKITTDRATRLKTGYIIEQPRNSNLKPSSDIQVLRIENISPRIGQNNLVISGTGPPNTVLKLYIYSDPIVVTTKTDASGNFTYTLDKNLLDGEHEVYVTINDDTGKITKQSFPLSFFIRRAQAVTEEEYLRGDVNIDSDGSLVVNKYVIPAVITVVALMLVFIGIFMLKRKQKEIE